MDARASRTASRPGRGSTSPSASARCSGIMRASDARRGDRRCRTPCRSASPAACTRSTRPRSTTGSTASRSATPTSTGTSPARSCSASRSAAGRRRSSAPAPRRAARTTSRRLGRWQDAPDVPARTTPAGSPGRGPTTSAWWATRSSREHDPSRARASRRTSCATGRCRTSPSAPAPTRRPRGRTGCWPPPSAPACRSTVSAAAGE